MVTWLRKAGDETRSDRIIDRQHDNGHGWREALGRAHGGDGVRQDHACPGLGKLASQFWKSLVVSGDKARVQHVITAVYQAVAAQSFLDRCDLSRGND